VTAVIVTNGDAQHETTRLLSPCLTGFIYTNASQKILTRDKSVEIPFSAGPANAAAEAKSRIKTPRIFIVSDHASASSCGLEDASYDRKNDQSRKPV
jgi:hypothetical protein